MDFKMMITERADEIAYNEYDVESFYDLPADIRDAVYKQAMNNTWDYLVDTADNLRKAQKENL